MAQRPLNTLKNWFITRAKPLQQQFWDWMDSYWHKDAMIPLTSISNLVEILNTIPKPVQVATLSAPGDVVVPADCIVTMISLQSEIPGDTIVYSKNAVAGVDDILSEELTTNKIFITQSPFAIFSGESIYFFGITHLTTIKIYKA
jgi:hypothetical protein